ncbi:hypothetical protein CMEL01_04170, partial [Colletotrichum melonis]
RCLPFIKYAACSFLALLYYANSRVEAAPDLPPHLLVPARVGGQIPHHILLLVEGQGAPYIFPHVHNMAGIGGISGSVEHDFQAGVDMPDLDVRAGPAVHGVRTVAQPDSAPPEGTAPLLGRAHVGHDGQGVEGAPEAALGDVGSDEDGKNLCELWYGKYDGSFMMHQTTTDMRGRRAARYWPFWPFLRKSLRRHQSSEPLRLRKAASDLCGRPLPSTFPAGAAA